MIRRPTWVLLIVLIALIGFTIYYNNKKALTAFETAATAETNYLFTSEEGLPTSIKVESSTGEVVELAHNPENKWVLRQPQETAADQGLAESAASQISTLRVVDDVDLGLDILGLDQPADIITIEFTGGKTHKLEVGSETPTQTGYYVRVDGERSVIVSKTNLDALLNLLTSPPYAETPTPSAAPPTETLTPTATPAPAVEETATPTP